MAKGKHGGARVKAQSKRKKTVNFLVRVPEHVLKDLKAYYPRYVVKDGKRIVNPENLNKQVTEFLRGQWLTLPRVKVEKI